MLSMRCEGRGGGRIWRLWVTNRREQAIAELKEALLAHGFACDLNPYDGLGDLPIPEEARPWVERALRGEWKKPA
jgi:hypothetical protein